MEVLVNKQILEAACRRIIGEKLGLMKEQAVKPQRQYGPELEDAIKYQLRLKVDAIKRERVVR
jgi:hypothetical protein